MLKRSSKYNIRVTHALKKFSEMLHVKDLTYTFHKATPYRQPFKVSHSEMLFEKSVIEVS